MTVIVNNVSKEPINTLVEFYILRKGSGLIDLILSVQNQFLGQALVLAQNDQ